MSYTGPSINRLGHTYVFELVDIEFKLNIRIHIEVYNTIMKTKLYLNFTRIICVTIILQPCYITQCYRHCKDKLR